MNELYQVPGLFLVALCHIVIIYYLSEHKYSKRKYIFYGCIFGVCFIGFGVGIYVLSGIVALFSYVALVICTFLYSCIVSRDYFSKKCFLFITYFCLFSVLDNSFKIMIKLLLPDIAASAGYYGAILLRSAVLLLILALYKKYAAPTLRSLSDIDRGRWWNLALIALIFYVVQVALSVENIRTSMPQTVLLLLFIIISFIMCAVYGVVFSNISYMKKDAEAALIRQNAEYLSERLSTLQEGEERHRRLRHDMRHHLETIAEYAKAGNVDNILTYIGEYSIDISETAVRQYSINRTMNNILSVYAGKASESGIAFSAKCNVPSELKVRDIDLIALMGNLLENALHGCQKSGKEQACIDVYIRLQSSRLIIVCDNTCPENLKLSGSLPSGKGIGISSILTVCQRYEGNLDYSVENGICSACAVLNL